MALILAGLCSRTAAAQALPVGVYTTAESYKRRAPEWKQAPGQPFRIATHTFWSRPYLTVFQGNFSYRVEKDSVFGWCIDGKTLHRSFNGGSCRLLSDSGSLWLYGQTLLSGNKYDRYQSSYFFSTGSHLQPRPLCITALLEVFSNHPLFCEWLVLAYRTNADLLRPNPLSAACRINHMLHIFNNLPF